MLFYFIQKKMLKDTDRLLLSGRTLRKKCIGIRKWNQKCSKYPSNFIMFKKIPLMQRLFQRRGVICHISWLCQLMTAFFAPWRKVYGTTSLFNKHLERAVSTDAVTFVQRFLGGHRRHVWPWHSGWAADLQSLVDTGWMLCFNPGGTKADG